MSIDDVMKYVIGNLKMNMIDTRERDAYFSALDRESRLLLVNADRVKLMIAPPLLYLERFIERVPKPILSGAQNAFWEARGSFTGETSPAALKNCGVSFVLCGHSERRTHLSETDEMVAKKVRATIDASMTAVLCVGESREEKEKGETASAVADQVSQALSGVSAGELKRMLIAYEPKWAIGTGEVPTTDEILQTRIILRRVLAKIYGAEQSESVPILYGGSVSASLVKAVCLDAGMDGCLAGKESLNPKDLFAIVNAML